MSRTQRLLELLQLLRQHRYPVKGTKLASTLGVSVRTIYRDIKTLQDQGATIDGEPGLGYVLQPGYMLPPLMFSEEEIEAFVLGMRWVVKSGDSLLSGAAYKALTKVAAVLPRNLRTQLEESSLLVGPLDIVKIERVELPIIRQAIRTQVKTHITYCDLAQETTTRTIWPFALAFFNQVRILVAWCELRQSFRHFRVDRLIDFTPTNVRYPKNRQALLKEWRQAEGIPSPEV